MVSAVDSCRVDAVTPVIAPRRGPLARGWFFPATFSSAHCSLLVTFYSFSTSVASLGHNVLSHNTTMTTSEREA